MYRNIIKMCIQRQLPYNYYYKRQLKQISLFYLMDNNKKTVKQNSNTKSNNLQISEMQNQMLTEIIKQIQEMQKMRLIQKLVRPIDNNSKQAIIVVFQKLFQSTNRKLIKFKNYLVQKQLSLDFRKQKHYKEEVSRMNLEVRKKVVKIQLKYNQIFYQGSFKHYEKVKKTFNLAKQLQPMNIVDWSNFCIQKLAGSSRSCC